MTNEQKFDLKNKFINRLGKRVFDICYGCITRLKFDSKENEDGNAFLLTCFIFFYNRPTLIIKFYINYSYLLNDVFNYNLKHFTIEILTKIYDILYKELDK